MTLLELSVSYQQSASVLQLRIAELRAEEKAQRDREAALAIRLRIAELKPLLREMRDLASLTAHYYDRGYYRDVRYRI